MRSSPNKRRGKYKYRRAIAHEAHGTRELHERENQIKRDIQRSLVVPKAKSVKEQ